RVLTAAGSGVGASDIFEFQKFGVRHLAGGIRAHGFKDILYGDILPPINTRRNGAAIKHQSRQIHSSKCHGGRGDGLVAADHTHDRVEKLAAAHQFNRVGDDLAADQRSLHAFGAHRLTVADGNGVELHGRAARRANALLHLGRQAAQVEVAGHGLNPGVGHANDGFAEIVIRKSNGLEHGAGGGPVAPISDTAAAMLRIHRVRTLRQGKEKKKSGKSDLRISDLRFQIAFGMQPGRRNGGCNRSYNLKSEIFNLKSLALTRLQPWAPRAGPASPSSRPSAATTSWRAASRPLLQWDASFPLRAERRTSFRRSCSPRSTRGRRYRPECAPGSLSSSL